MLICQCYFATVNVLLKKVTTYLLKVIRTEVGQSTAPRPETFQQLSLDLKPWFSPHHRCTGPHVVPFALLYCELYFLPS